MKLTRNILTLTLLSAGLSFAGIYEKQVVQPPLCGPWYMSIFGGGSFFSDGSFSGTDFVNEEVRDANFGFDNGWIAGAAIGVRTANDWRFEIEFNHNQAPVDDGSFSFTDLDDGDVDLFGGLASGDVETSSLMLNIAKEFPALTFWNLRPYLGAGVGLSNVRTQLLLQTPGLVESFEGDDIVLGYQAMAGLVLDLTECLQLYAEYRVTGHGDSEDVLSELNGIDPVIGSLDMDWTQHAILGVRWFF